LSTPYLSKLPNGTYRYRRGVPEELRDALGVREIKKSLGKDLTKAMQRYAEVHREAEKALEAARLQERPSLRDEVLQVLKKHKVSQGILQRIDAAEDGLDPDDPRDLNLMMGLDALQQELIEDYEDAEARGADPKVSLEAIRAIGAPRIPPHTYTVVGALDFYVKERRGENDTKNKALENRITNLKKRMIRILGEDAVVKRSLERMTREDALKVRDGLLAEKGLGPATVRKMIGIAKAAINLTMVEFDLDIKNRFEKLKIKGSGPSKEDRHSLTEKDLALVDPVMARGSGDPLSAIWVTLRDTRVREPVEHVGLVFAAHRAWRNRMDRAVQFAECLLLSVLHSEHHYPIPHHSREANIGFA